MATEDLPQSNDLRQALSAPLTEGQKLKVRVFQQALNLQGVVAKSLQLEQRRTTTLFGAESGEARTLKAVAAAHQQVLAITKTASDLAQARAPLADPREFIIYGTVKDSAGKAMPKITVSAVDDNDTVVRNAVAEEDGSYVLRIGPDEGPAVSRLELSTPQDTAATLRVIASDEKRTLKVESPTRFVVQPGKLAYLELTVPV